jgi:serine phosphatase RsbU (regulator of sigma subunit)
MGDVEGHGLRSAVAMGRLRSALRAYALDYEDPAEVLYRLDRKLCFFEGEISATVLYAVTAPPFDVLTICNAGHPAPLIAQRGEPFAEVADVSSGLLLGLDPEQQGPSEQVPFSPGAALAFYTDGLVERRQGSARNSDPDVERLEIVRRTFVAGDNAETACSRIIAGGLGDDSVEDDVALVVVRRPV